MVGIIVRICTQLQNLVVAGTFAFDSKTLQFSEETAVPSGGGVVRHMVYDPATKSIWFGSDNNTIGQATLPPRTAPAPTP